jgi:hypothetical protein
VAVVKIFRGRIERANRFFKAAKVIVNRAKLNVERRFLVCPVVVKVFVKRSLVFEKLFTVFKFEWIEVYQVVYS